MDLEWSQPLQIMASSPEMARPLKVAMKSIIRAAEIIEKQHDYKPSTKLGEEVVVRRRPRHIYGTVSANIFIGDFIDWLIDWFYWPQNKLSTEL